jgi:hypothetical protein
MVFSFGETHISHISSFRGGMILVTYIISNIFGIDHGNEFSFSFNRTRVPNIEIYKLLVNTKTHKNNKLKKIRNFRNLVRHLYGCLRFVQRIQH